MEGVKFIWFYAPNVKTISRFVLCRDEGATSTSPANKILFKAIKAYCGTILASTDVVLFDFLIDN